MASLNCTSKAENEWETLERVGGKEEVRERRHRCCCKVFAREFVGAQCELIEFSLHSHARAKG